MNICEFNAQIQKKRSRNSYTALSNGVVSFGAPIGVFSVFLATQMETNTNKMHPRSSGVLQHFMCCYLHTQTAVHTQQTNHSCFKSREKVKYLCWSLISVSKWHMFWDLWSTSVQWNKYFMRWKILLSCSIRPTLDEWVSETLSILT